MHDVLRAARSVRRRYAPTIDDVVFDRYPWEPDSPPSAFAVPMLIGTCRTELSSQLGTIGPTSFEITDDDLEARLRPFMPGDDAVEAIRLVRAASPGASASEVYFTVTTELSYWRDSVVQTEYKAAQADAGGAPGLVVSADVADTDQGGRRITPHSTDLPFVFDNVAVARHMVGRASEATAQMREATAAPCREAPPTERGDRQDARDDGRSEDR